MDSGIYAIHNTVSDKFYIGSSVTISRRWDTHRSRLSLGRHHSRHLQSAWNKYGSAAFRFLRLEMVADPQQLAPREQVWIDRCNPEYNTVTAVGAAPMLGRHHTAQARQKMSVAATGKTRGPLADVTKERIAAHFRGKPLSATHRAKLSRAKQGTTRGMYSPEHRARIAAGVAAAHKRRKETP